MILRAGIRYRASFSEHCWICSYIQKRPQLVFPRVAEILSKLEIVIPIVEPLGAPTLSPLAKPTGTESPPVPPRAASAKPDAP